MVTTPADGRAQGFAYSANMNSVCSGDAGFPMMITRWKQRDSRMTALADQGWLSNLSSTLVAE